MGTRQVYEEKLRSGNLHHDPTINPGLGSPRCPRCLSLINPNSGNGEWAITSVLHDVTAVAGCGAGGMLGAIHGFNTGKPFVEKHVKGPKWLQLLIGIAMPFLFLWRLFRHRRQNPGYEDGQTEVYFRITWVVFGVHAMIPPLILFSGASAAFGGFYVWYFFLKWFYCSSWQPESYKLKQFLVTRGVFGFAVPRFAQLSVTSYYAASSASQYAISQGTRYVEEAHSSHTLQDKSR